MGFLLQMGQEFILQHSSFILALLDEVIRDAAQSAVVGKIKAYL
jgi:hypothetical protein